MIRYIFNFRGIIARRVFAAAVGIILLTAAILKSYDIELFMRQIKDYGIISDHLQLIICAWGLIIAEFVLGASLIVYYRPRISVLLSIALFCVFIGATLWAWVTGVTEDCGCFGSWVERSPGGAMIEDLFITGALFIAWPGRDYKAGAGSRVRLLIVIASLIAGLTLPVFYGAPVRDLLGIETGDGAKNENMFFVQGLEDIDMKKGTFLFVLVGADCQHCRDSVKDFNRLAKKDDLPEIIGLSMDYQEDIDAFVEDLEPAYPVLQISEDEFYRLLGMGTTPYSILVNDRQVIRTWDEEVPKVSEITEALAK